MDLLPSPEEALLAETATALASRVAEDPAGPGHAVWVQMVDLGWTELDPLSLALVVEALGRAGVPTPLPVTVALRNALPALAARAAPDAVLTLAALVPGAADERAGPHPAVVDGTVTGTALLVPDAAAAAVVVVAVADGLVAVDPRGPGVTTRVQPTVDGDPAWRVDLDRAPATRVTGTLDSVVDHLAVAGLARATGAADAALALSVRHASERHQFGRPIGAFQAVAHRCADMRAEVDACRYLCYRAAWALTHATDVRFAVDGALAYAKEGLRRVAMHAHQVHGAMGFSTEHPLHRFTLPIKAFELTLGSAAAAQERFARSLGLVW